MADDIRQLLHDAAPGRERPPDFDRLWSRARRQRRSSRIGGAVAGVVVLEGGHREPEPEITVTWERLDDPDAATVTVDEGTNAHTFDDGWFMLAGLDPGRPGCWRVTATYEGAELAYVYLAEPPE